MLNFITKLKSYLPTWLRIFLHKLYFNNFITLIENILNKNKIKHRELIIEDKDKIISNFTRSLIRHNLYEKYELEASSILFNKPEDLIDLGSSIGIVSLSTAMKQKGKKIVLVEPVIEYLEFSKNLFHQHSENTHHFVNKAVDYSNKDIFLEKKDILNSEINYLDGKNINKTTLFQIVSEYNIDFFNLIIDIEGKSFEPIFEDEKIMEKCKNLIIEEEFDTKYTEVVVMEKLSQIGFEVKYFEKSRNSNIIGATNINLSS